MAQTLMFMQAANAPRPSPIGTPAADAMGLGDESMGSLRISLSRYTTDDDIANTLEAFKAVLAA